MSEVKDASAGRPSSLTVGKLRFKQTLKEAAKEQVRLYQETLKG